MKQKNIIILLLIVLITSFVISNVFLINKILFNQENYNPQINPKDFVQGLSNKYFSFTQDKIFVYEGRTEEGIERTEVYATGETKRVMGVNAAVVRDRVWLNNELVEDTKDWFAQDKYENVWYFGEDSKEIVKGRVASTKGSWEAGINGAKPGIIMKANPKVGDSYRQEYYKDEAEDMAEVVSLGVNIKVKYGSFSDCVQIKEWNPLEQDSDEYKYYCPGIGNLVYEIGLENGEGAQLINIEKISVANTQTEEPFEALKTEITEQEAISIAKKYVEGTVTDVAIETKYGKVAYVVEIDSYGQETDVIININTGKVLGIET